MSAKLKAPALRVLGELTVIVAGVLIALFVDASRQTHEDQQRALQLLQAVHSDLIADSAYIAGHFEAFDDQLVALRQLIEIDRHPSVPKDRLREIMSQIGRVTPDRWNTSGYSALLGSGDLRLIDDVELSPELARYYAQVIPGARAEAEWDVRYGAAPVWVAISESPGLRDPFSVTTESLTEGDTYDFDPVIVLRWSQENRLKLLERESTLAGLLSVFRRTETSRVSLGRRVTAYLTARGAL